MSSVWSCVCRSRFVALVACPSAGLPAHLAGCARWALHLVWCPTYRRRVRGGRVAHRLGELLEQIAAERGWQIVVIENQRDAVMAS